MLQLTYFYGLLTRHAAYLSGVMAPAGAAGNHVLIVKQVTQDRKFTLSVMSTNKIDSFSNSAQ